MRKRNQKLKKYFFSFIAIIMLFSAFSVSADVELNVRLPDIAGQGLSSKSTLPEVIKYSFTVAIILCVLAVLASLIYGGFMYLSSAGDPTKMAAGKKRIIGAAMGLVIVVGSYLVLYFINPQLLILRVEKVPITHGVLLLNKEAHDAIYGFDGIDQYDEYEVLADTSATDEDLKNVLQKLLDAEDDEPKAVYARNSISDAKELFGKRERRFVGDDVNWRFKDLDLFAVYFLPGSNVKMLTFMKPDFFNSSLQENVYDNQYIYPKCSREDAGPCKFDLLDGKSEYKEQLGGISGALVNLLPVKQPPESIVIQGIGEGVYLYSNDFGEELVLKENNSIAFLKDEGFNNNVKKIEIRNWIEQQNEDDEWEYNKTTNYLAILYEDEQFRGQFRMFFEHNAVPLSMSINEAWQTGSVGNLRENLEDIGPNPNNLAVLDISESKMDRYGKVDKPSSIQVLRMPGTGEEWSEWGQEGCVIKLCAKPATYMSGTDADFQDCLVYTTSEASETDNEVDKDAPMFVPVSIPITAQIDNDQDGVADLITAENINDSANATDGVDAIREVAFQNNIKSISIKGFCMVALFENSIENKNKCTQCDPYDKNTENSCKACWKNEKPGEDSEIFLPCELSEECRYNNGYRDLTEQNAYYTHTIGSCKCKLKEQFGGIKTYQDCESCAASIAVYPILMPDSQQ